MAVEIFNPQIDVTVFKNIGMGAAGPGAGASQRYNGTRRAFSLNHHLGENSSVSISKSIRECYGSFRITLTDAMVTQRAGTIDVPTQADTLSRLLQPLDVIEIRASRQSHTAAGRKLPLLMRGYIRRISRRERMTDQGPQRFVIIEGGDAGVLLDLCRSNLIPGAPNTADVQDAFTFYSTWFNKSANAVSASDFVAGCVKGILAPMISTMQAAGEISAAATAVAAGLPAAVMPSPVRQITPVTLVERGVVYLIGVDARWNGNTLYGLMQQYGDIGLGLNELFVQTVGLPGQEQDYLVFRPAPFIDTDGQYLLAPYTPSSGTAAAGYPQTFTVQDTELVELDTERDDSRVFNFIYLLPEWLIAGGETTVIQNAWATLAKNNTISNQNSAQTLYGFRPIFLTEQEGPRVDGQDAGDYGQSVKNALAELQSKTADLKAINANNVVWEQGSAVIRGRPDIMPGNYVELHRGDFVEKLYVTAVNHEFLPFRTYTTGLQFERGNGFIAAIRDGNAPYLREMTDGVSGVYGA